jgi:hypothetical protein
VGKYPTVVTMRSMPTGVVVVVQVGADWNVDGGGGDIEDEGQMKGDEYYYYYYCYLHCHHSSGTMPNVQMIQVLCWPTASHVILWTCFCTEIRKEHVNSLICVYNEEKHS